MTSQTEKQIITIHILINISRSKGNQTMKYRQEIEQNMRNIFLGKSYIGGYIGEPSPRPFSEKSKLERFCFVINYRIHSSRRLVL